MTKGNSDLSPPLSATTPWTLLSLRCLVVLMSVMGTMSATEVPECGDYIVLKAGDSGTLTSPDYPSIYPVYSRCIWLIQTVATDYRVQLDVTFNGERYNGACSDYVEIRDGNSTAQLLAQMCDNHTSQSVISGNIWMWIYFRSDAITGSGSAMTASYTTFYNTTAPDNPYPAVSECRSYEFECRNMQCLSMSYRCDGYNDCGCGSECDEDGCGPLSISKGAQVGISVSVGVVVFLLVCLLAYVIEGKNSWVASKDEAIREKELLEAEKRRRVTRAFSRFVGDNKEYLVKGSSNRNSSNNVPSLSVTEFDDA